MNRLEKSIEGEAKLIRLNLKEDVGRDMWNQYLLNLVPAFLVFDSNGQEVWRQQGQFPDTQKILETVRLNPGN